MNENIKTFITLLVLFFSLPVQAWNTLSSDLDINCHQLKASLSCDYRVHSNTKISDITSKSNDLNLDVTKNSSYPETGDTTAVLILVDTSDPARQNVIEKNKVHIKNILTTLKPHHKVGLASFDKSLKILSAIGSSTFLLSKSLDNLKAAGKTTELYRNLLKAMEQLNSFGAQRKVIILLSDGQAEDKAYFHSDIIKMARKNNIVINSIGYPRSVSLSVALQTLRRLSEETGGKYIETNSNYNLPDTEINKLFGNIDNGGSFSVSLESLFKNNVATDSITLSFLTDKGIKNIQTPVRINIKKQTQIQPTNTPLPKTPANTTSLTSNNNSSAPIQIITKQPPAQPINLWLWYGLPAAFIIIIIFILITLFLLWRKPEQRSSGSNTDYKPYAYLISKDEKGTRYPITRTICRIGRSKDNELKLDDTSISRRHAEIHRNNDGTFEIIDMNSMNGVYINNEKVGKAELHEGDLLEIGDFFLHFTQLASDHSLEESTVMQKTRTPSTH